MTTSTQKPLLLGCGILQEEILFLIQKNGWPFETYFFDSTLHIDYDKLSSTVTSALNLHSDREKVLFYGACHPLMDNILDSAETFRTTGQNCVEMLLGKELFTNELADGAFFLLKDWALNWERVVTATFGKNREVIREMYQGDRRYLLCISTPCSGDFRTEAEAAGLLVGLPLRWINVSLDHLEAVLQESVDKIIRESLCKR